MKIILYESQYNRLNESSEKTRNEKLIISLYKSGKSMGMIKTITGFNMGEVLNALKDEFSIENYSCDQIYKLFYEYVFGSKLIKKNHTYDDGSMIEIFFHYFDMTLSFTYYNGSRWVSGYATFLYEGECEIPFDGSYYGVNIEGKKPWDSKYYDKALDSVLLSNNKKFNNMKTIGDLINFFNNDYYDLIKPKLNELDEFYQELK